MGTDHLLTAAKFHMLSDAQGGFVSYMFVFAALLLLVMYFVANKFVQKRLGSGTKEALLYSCLRSFISALLFFLVYVVTVRRLPEINSFSLVLSIILASLVCAYTLLGFRIMHFGSLSVYTVFLMLGGMIVPYLYGVIWLDEEIRAFRIAGIVLMIISLFFPLIGNKDSAGGPSQSTAKKRVIFGVICFAVFMLNGLVSVVSKTHAIKMSDQRPVLITFVMLCALSNGVLSLASLLVLKAVSSLKKAKKTVDSEEGNGEGALLEAGAEPGGEGAEPPKKRVFLSIIKAVLPAIALAAAFDGASFFFQQLGASQLPASVMYPIQTGGSIVLTALAGFLIFKEKQSKIALIGLAITFASTFLFLF